MKLQLQAMNSDFGGIKMEWVRKSEEEYVLGPGGVYVSRDVEEKQKQEELKKQQEEEEKAKVRQQEKRDERISKAEGYIGKPVTVIKIEGKVPQATGILEDFDYKYFMIRTDAGAREMYSWDVYRIEPKQGDGMEQVKAADRQGLNECIRRIEKIERLLDDVGAEAADAFLVANDLSMEYDGVEEVVNWLDQFTDVIESLLYASAKKNESGIGADSCLEILRKLKG
jgi:cellobiose-specific phosphotransferase system component IIB